MKNSSVYGLPENVIFCKLCVISNQRPSSTVEFKSSGGESKSGISINDNGICDACSYNKKKSGINWKEREKQLLKFLEKYCKQNNIILIFDEIVTGFRTDQKSVQNFYKFK